MDDQAKLTRFGELIRERRLSLGMTQQDVVDADGPSDRSQTKVEHGVLPMPSATTLAKLEKALRLRKGSAAAALHRNRDLVPLEDERPLTEDDVRRRVELELALANAGVKRVAARTHSGGEGLKLPNDVVDDIIALLNTVRPGDERQ